MSLEVYWSTAAGAQRIVSMREMKYSVCLVYRFLVRKRSMLNENSEGSLGNIIWGDRIAYCVYYLAISRLSKPLHTNGIMSSNRSLLITHLMNLSLKVSWSLVIKMEMAALVISSLNSADSSDEIMVFWISLALMTYQISQRPSSSCYPMLGFFLAIVSKYFLSMSGSASFLYKATYSKMTKFLFSVL